MLVKYTKHLYCNLQDDLAIHISIISANSAEHKANLRQLAVHFSFPPHQLTCLKMAHEKNPRVLRKVSL